MINVDINTGKLFSQKTKMVFAEGPYCYGLSCRIKGKGEKFESTVLLKKKCVFKKGAGTISGYFFNGRLQFSQFFCQKEDHLEEVITLKNVGAEAVEIKDINLGFTANITIRPKWRLCAIPFRVQLDGSMHDYSTEALVNGAFSNAVAQIEDNPRPEPLLADNGCLWSEAWAWGTDKQGLVIIKYNNKDIELSVARVQRKGGESTLRFGGAGFSLYGEPSSARSLAPGETAVFGTTLYYPFEGGLTRAFICYRNFLDSKGHGFPKKYNPSVNWNELYDIGWFHSDAKLLKKHYTRQALLQEAAKAKACGCELLYLDPGWEKAEGTTLWGESRLGKVSGLVKTLKKDYCLNLGYRTILRCYKDRWPQKYLVKHSPGEELGRTIKFGEGQIFFEPCLCNKEFWQKKLQRILKISKDGIRFMMFDEMDWRGPCYDLTHGHSVPTSPLDHISAVYALSEEVRKQCPGLITEVHDPVWPWRISRYVPTYFRQGFEKNGSYDENWGFEYMWDCINDLKSGKALALYYYNLGCNVPLYLHITMAADNDRCLFFWWAASTVRHLGIGGKDSHESVEPIGKLPAYNHGKRFAAYKKQMKIYRKLKPYFTRGEFHGLAENIHLHTIPEVQGGVVVVFNLEETEKKIEFFIPFELLGGPSRMVVKGAEAEWTKRGMKFQLNLAGMSPGVIHIAQ